MAIGNSAEANLANSVALGYESTTNYFYTGNDGVALRLLADKRQLT